MAPLPTQAKVEQALLEVIAEYKPRPNEIVPLADIKTKLHELGFRGREIYNALRSLQEKGWISGSASSVHVVITEEGFKHLPSKVAAPQRQPVASPPPQKQEEVIFLKPALWGINIDLKALGRWIRRLWVRKS